jgi:hypothetical protein
MGAAPALDQRVALTVQPGFHAARVQKLHKDCAASFPGARIFSWDQYG